MCPLQSWKTRNKSGPFRGGSPIFSFHPGPWSSCRPRSTCGPGLARTLTFYVLLPGLLPPIFPVFSLLSYTSCAASRFFLLEIPWCSPPLPSPDPVRSEVGRFTSHPSFHRGPACLLPLPQNHGLGPSPAFSPDRTELFASAECLHL